MQTFTETQRQEPEKAEVPERLNNFEEIYRFFDNKHVRRQAERCVQCGDPFCSVIGCPLQNYIPQWLEAISARDLERAFRLSNESSPFPEILGRICPQSHLCEGACTLDDGYGAISIGAIEASITDLAFGAGMELEFPGVRHDKRVAVVGSGPAGFSCAHFLLRAGIGVDMYERADRPGGLLTYGIPGFKLDKKIVENRFNILRKAGLNLYLNQELGEQVALKKLAHDCDAVFLGVGATRGKLPNIENQDHAQVHLAMDFLTQQQRRLFECEWDARYDVYGKRVVVIGGGDTAMDCVRTAVRDGASEVTCLYRRDQTNMPGSEKEFHNAIEEGVEFLFNESPIRVALDDTGDLVGIEMIRTRLAEPGADGRQRVELVEGSEHCVSADIIIMALGFDMESIPGLKEADVWVGDWGQLLIDPHSGETSQTNIYAGGDCQRGADLVVTAAADGRRAAFAIMEKLLG
ncbi:MAG: glutamate synthase subunit beta [Desulfuromonadaceae bacterium]